MVGVSARTLCRVSRLLLPVLACVLLLGACGDNDDGGGASGSCEVQVAGAANQKPDVTVPDCDPPKELQSKSITDGTGEALAAGQTAVVHYVGISWSTREQFDASWDVNQPIPVENVGAANVITGWNEGLLGMRVGERRLLVIPPDKGYGPDGRPPIKPDETLVFVVDMVQIGTGQLQ